MRITPAQYRPSCVVVCVQSLNELLCAGYGYATLANLIICLMAMFGIVVLVFSACTQVFELCIQFCISLAVGSLTGDALLHLLPAVSNARIQHNTHALALCISLESENADFVLQSSCYCYKPAENMAKKNELRTV